MSITAQEKIEPCSSCGRPAADLLATEVDNVILCENCISRVRSGQEISYWGPSEPEPTWPPEERFSDLRKAAQILLREGVTEEDRIYPTLAFANELG
jgi:hypothetical protein